MRLLHGHQRHAVALGQLVQRRQLLARLESARPDRGPQERSRPAETAVAGRPGRADPRATRRTRPLAQLGVTRMQLLHC